MIERDEIIRIAARGDGVTSSGRHVADSAPGDWLDADGVLHFGPHHNQPPCQHYGRCGGCQLQHVDDASLASFYESRISNALAAQGVTAGDVRPAYLSPPASRRRATLKTQRFGGKLVLGYSEAGSHKLVDLRACDILRPELFALLAPLRTMLAKLLGPRDAATVHLALADQGADVQVSGVSALGLDAHEAIMAFCEGHSVARFAVDGGEGPEDRWAPEPATLTLGGVAVPLPHAGFLQATVDGERQLVALVEEAVGNAGHVADLFCGIGTFALSLSLNGKVHAAEAGRDALLALTLAANKAQRPVTVEHRDLYRRPLTAGELGQFDAVVLDPPRAGAQEQVRELAQSIVPTIAYVSCNPASFARDAAILVAGGYSLDWVQPVGQFRWSTHVELAAKLSRNF